MRLFIVILVTSFSLTVFGQQGKNSLHETFNRVGNIIESKGCPGDFVNSVSSIITKVCGDAKEGVDIEPVKYLKDTSEDAPEIFCSYEDGVYELEIGDTSDEPSASQVKITVTESGQVTEIIKDELKVEGNICRDLASRLDKGGRIPASVDTELCFDYYPSTKFMVGRDSKACKKSKKDQ